MSATNSQRNLGLTPDQSSIYLALLDSGPQTAIALARLTGIKRTYIYHLCKELEKENLLRLTQKGRTTFFQAQPPDLLLTKAQEKKAQAETSLIALESLLPDLQAKYRLNDIKPTISYYEGIEGIKHVYLDTLKSPTPILALVETSSVDKDIYNWVTQVYAPERVKQKIPVQTIVESGNKTATYVKKNTTELRETKTILSSKFPVEHEINIYGEKIALINHKAGSKLMAIIIDNKDIADTFRSWFKLTWSLL